MISRAVTCLNWYHLTVFSYCGLIILLFHDSPPPLPTTPSMISGIVKNDLKWQAIQQALHCTFVTGFGENPLCIHKIWNQFYCLLLEYLKIMWYLWYFRLCSKCLSKPAISNHSPRNFFYLSNEFLLEILREKIEEKIKRWACISKRALCLIILPIMPTLCSILNSTYYSNN